MSDLKSPSQFPVSSIRKSFGNKFVIGQTLYCRFIDLFGRVRYLKIGRYKK